MSKERTIFDKLHPVLKADNPNWSEDKNMLFRTMMALQMITIQEPGSGRITYDTIGEGNVDIINTLSKYLSKEQVTKSKEIENEKKECDIVTCERCKNIYRLTLVKQHSYYRNLGLRLFCPFCGGLFDSSLGGNNMLREEDNG